MQVKRVILEKHGYLPEHEDISKITGIRRRLDMDILDPIATWLECDPEDLYEIVEIDDSGETS